LGFWQLLPDVLKPIPLREFKGVSKLNAFSIKETYLTQVKNLTASKYPALKVRPGFSLLGSSLGAKVTGLSTWKDTELHAIAGGEWKKWDGSSWSTTLASSLSTSALCSFCNFKGNLSDINLIMANGADAVKRYDGNTVQDLTDAPAGANYIDQHDNRLYAAVGNIVYFSALRKADDWTTAEDAGQIAVEVPSGESISGLKAGPQHIVCFTPHTTHELYGTGPLNYRMQQISGKKGCVANNTCLMVGGVLYWLSHQGVERYTGGVAPKNDFSLPVWYYIEGINKEKRHLSCAGTDGRRYYLAIPYGSATEPNVILEYDPNFGTWYVWEYSNDITAFACMQEEMYFGDDAGQVVKVGGTDDNGNAIEWEAVTKPFGAGSLVQPKQWYKLWIVADMPTGSTCNVYLTKTAEGDSDWTLVKSIDAASDIQSTRIIIPVETVANANWVRVKFAGTGPATIYEMTRQERLMPFR